MALDKQELKLLLTELKKVFATKKELEEIDVDVDIDWDSIDVAYVGEEEPENENAIWFDSGEDSYNTISYDNPVVDEIFACIRTLQDQVKKLQEDVEYLKLYGGSGGIDRPDEEPDIEETVDIVFALEDGGLFLLEDGGFLIFEESITVEVNKDSTLALEDGSLFLLEDGGFLILEESIEKITESLLMLENGARLLYENGSEILLEKNNK